MMTSTLPTNNNNNNNARYSSNIDDDHDGHDDDKEQSSLLLIEEEEHDDDDDDDLVDEDVNNMEREIPLGGGDDDDNNNKRAPFSYYLPRPTPTTQAPAPAGSSEVTPLLSEGTVRHWSEHYEQYNDHDDTEIHNNNSNINATNNNNNTRRIPPVPVDDLKVISISPNFRRLTSCSSFLSLASYEAGYNNNNNNNDSSTRGSLARKQQYCYQYDDPTTIRTIRFQVVVWYIGAPDEVHGKVEMKFRVTIFWYDPYCIPVVRPSTTAASANAAAAATTTTTAIATSTTPTAATATGGGSGDDDDHGRSSGPTILGTDISQDNNNNDHNDDGVEYGTKNPYNRRVWKMYGRQRAYETRLKGIDSDDDYDNDDDDHNNRRIVYVPPVSILNAVDFDTIGDPEVCRLDTTNPNGDRLMRWSCLYRASLLQDNMQVAQFPHDSHDLVLRLGVLKHRQRRKRWDKRIWKLDLATRDDTDDSIDTPHGTMVGHVRVPGFNHGRELEFEFLPLQFGAERGSSSTVDPAKPHPPPPPPRDECLQVKIRVVRESSYFDRNIIPLLAFLNLVGVCTLALSATEFGSRGEIILATSFVEIGIRMTVDSRLPVVGYQIKMQFVLNNFFYGLLFLVVESSLAYLLQDAGHKTWAAMADRMAAILEVSHMVATLYIYYKGSGGFCDSVRLNCFKKNDPTDPHIN